MRTTVCPRCGKHILHAQGEAPYECDAVSCGYAFPVIEQERTLPARPGPAPEPEPMTVPELPPGPVISAPQLAAPHRCPRCLGEIHQPAGRRRATIDHECGNRTDLYAILFRAPCCGAFVELPRSLAGKTHRCPACPRSFVGPRDDVIHRTLGDVSPGQVMRFICPNSECLRRLQCNTHLNGDVVAGQLVVCPACAHVITVPAAGRAVIR